MRWAHKLFSAIIVVYLLAVIFANRGIFFSRFDEVYWKDKYDHSQWKLPLSVRTLGDDGLYLYEGYRLTTGGDPTLLNAEVPPLGKYLIGTVIRVTGNGYWFGFITTVALLFVFYTLAKALLPRGILPLALTTLLATDPLITNQYTLTMLDALQSLWLILFLYLFTKFTCEKSKNNWLLIASGVSLGFFGETKFPLLLPIPISIVFMSLIFAKNRMKNIGIFFGGITFGYLLPYAFYFLSGNTLLDWLRVQKWIVAFYLHAKLIPTYGSALINLLTGSFQNIFSRTWLHTEHWSPIWTLVTVSLLFLFRRQTIQDKQWRPIFLLAIIVLGFYAVIPFWTRYLVLLLPLLYLLFGFLIRKLGSSIATWGLICCVSINIASSIHHFFPTAEGTLSLFTYNWNNHFFQDMYEDVDSKTKTSWSRENFRKRGLSTIAEGEIEKAEVTYTYPQVSRFTSHVEVPVKVTYITRHLGAFTFPSNISLQKENNRWKVVWNWNMYIPDMNNFTHLSTIVQEAKRGSIIASDKSILAADFPSYMIWITPQKIIPTEEKQLLELLENLFNHTIKAVYFHQRIYGNTLSNQPIPIGVIPKKLTEEERQKLTTFGGVTLTPHAGRFAVVSDFTKIGTVANSQYFECCSYLYTTTSYDGIDGVEKEKNDILKGINGGLLNLIDKNGVVRHTFIYREQKNGTDVQP